MKTRLDPVVRFRESRERKALERVAQANEDARTAKGWLEKATQQASADPRGHGAAAEWAMVEAARERALAEVKRASDQVAQSAKVVDTALSGWRSEHRQTEVVRRVAESRRDEARGEQARRDSRELDEIASMMFWRKPA